MYCAKSDEVWKQYDFRHRSTMASQSFWELMVVALLVRHDGSFGSVLETKLSQV